MSGGTSIKLQWLEKAVLSAGFFLCAIMVLVVVLDNDFNLLTRDQQGQRLFEKGEFKEAAERFTSPEWKGVALYRDGQFEAAAAAFSGSGDLKALFNGGNSLLMLGKYTEAIERYERALSLKPNWHPAMNNLSIAREREKALEKKGGEMTGGKLGADEYVFSNNPSNEDGAQEVVAGEEPSEAELRAIWLRQVQTKPADFLRTKFAYQYQMRSTP